jgi:hypothetical protein
MSFAGERRDFRDLRDLSDLREEGDFGGIGYISATRPLKIEKLGVITGIYQDHFSGSLIIFTNIPMI